MSQYYDAFISYGRPDSKAFATKLYNDLTKQGFKIWFDQNDIPLAVDFQNQIDDGIEKAHNFLFIIAPHSVNSEYCLKEIEQAVQYKKRIIPLLHVEEISYETWQERNPGKTEADWQEDKRKGKHSHFPNMHPEIRRINWVYFRESVDNYDGSLAGLIDLFHQHENYVQKHTQILVKALDWERHQKQTRYLLTGKERQGAEDWLKVEFTNEQPPCHPTDLHCEFICESIKNANNLMTKVFLSYSEKNREAMEKIRRSLMRHGITVWTNKTDIKKGSKFAEEINRGIEGADTLVYLVSPDALKSRYCQDEVSHALSLNKRLITLLIEPTDDELLPESIRSLEYIDLSWELSEAKYQEGANKLIKELGENAVYYQQHKVLLVKAIKWDRQNRNRSLFLRGYNLEHYQSWLEVARTKNLHPPTDLQVEFIAESSKQPPDSGLDVFLSYSRADGDFARRLNNALQTQGKTTWFDQESIATATDFQAEIYQGIEQSDNFLFVISPESVNSPYCQGEVERAKSLNKRFVTVLHRGVNTADLHPELAKVQWLDFNRYGGDFLGNFSELVRTLDTDREYVREHTKMSQKALEWSKRDKSVDLLLRGNECVRAYEWLQFAEQQGKKPELTEQLKEYILASKEELDRLQLEEVERQQRELRRKLERKNQNKKFLILSISIPIFCFLLIIAIWQTIEANKKSQIAEAYKLAAESENVAGRNFYGRGTLLALESMKKSQKLKNPRLYLAADMALRSGLALLPDSISEVNHDEGVTDVAISPDGKYIATASEDNTARVWSAATGEQIAKVNHDAEVTDVAISPDGKYIATASSDKTARVWSAATGEQIAKVNHDDKVTDVAISPDGQYIATASSDNTAGVWSAATGEEVAKVNHDAEVYAVAISPDGKYIATASSDNTARVWLAATGEEIAKVNHDAEVYAVAFSPYGKYIATASEDNTARVWEAATGELIGTITHDAPLLAVAFSPYGKYVATASYDKTAGVWDTARGELIATITHDDRVRAVAFSPDGKYLATASYDNTAGVWEAATGKEIAKVNHDDRVRAVAFSPDGKYIATASYDNTAGVWSAATAKGVTKVNHNDWVTGVAISPDGKYIATASWDKTSRVWSAATGEEIATITHDAPVWAVAISPDGKYIATASWDKTSRVWSAATGEQIAKVNHDDKVTDVAISPDGQYLATASEDKTARVWEAATGKEIAKVNHDAPVYAVAFSPDGKYLATASEDKTAGVWLAATGEKIAKVNHDDKVTDVAFSPDGKYIATASFDNTARVWLAATGKEVAKVNHDAPVWAVAISPDGKYIATASFDNTAGVWSAATGELIAKVNHDAPVWAVAISQDGKYIATASFDNTARVWSAATGEQIATITHDAEVIAVAISPDDKYVATASYDNTAGVHFKKAEDAMEEACRRLSRNLTADEWEKYYMNQPLHEYHKTCESLPAHRSLLAKARKLAQENELKEAEKLLEALLKFDNKIDLLPTTEALEQNPGAVVRQFQAEGKVSEGVRKAKNGKIEEAIALFKEAVEWQPDIDLNPQTEEIDNDPQTVAQRLAASAKVSEGVRKAKNGKIEEAIALFKQAVEWQPDIDLNPDTKEIDSDPEAVARQFAAD